MSGVEGPEKIGVLDGPLGARRQIEHQQIERSPLERPEDLAERIERLVLRHEELKRTSALLEQQLVAVGAERDSLRSRLAAARARIDALLDRLPAEPAVVRVAPAVAPAAPAAFGPSATPDADAA